MKPILSLFLGILLFVNPVPAATIDNTFTYQGRLTDGGTMANGNYDLRFILYTAEAGNTCTKGRVFRTFFRTFLCCAPRSSFRVNGRGRNGPGGPPSPSR